MAAAAGKDLDEFYTYDRIYQLANLDRGDLNPGKTAISGTPDWEVDLTLDPTGNWSGYVQAAGPPANRCCRTTANNPLPLVAGLCQKLNDL